MRRFSFPTVKEKSRSSIPSSVLLLLTRSGTKWLIPRKPISCKEGSGFRKKISPVNSCSIFPFLKYRTRSASLRSQASRCSATITVFPCAFHKDKIFSSSWIVPISRLDVGSSKTKISGSKAWTEAHAIFCFSPPLSVNKFRPSSGSNRIAVTVSSNRISISFRSMPIFSQEKTISVSVTRV